VSARQLRRRLFVLAAAWLSALVAGGAAAGDDAARLATQWQQYEAERPKTLVELQPFRNVTSMPAATLTQLNPGVNVWWIFETGAAGAPRRYHLENPAPATQTPMLVDDGLHLRSAERDALCLTARDALASLEQARASKLPYAPLCGGRLYLRNVVPGTYTQIERMTNLLRDHVWGGDRIVGFVREQFFRDAFIEKEGAVLQAADGKPPAGAPPPARLGAAFAGQAVVPEHLGLDAGDPRRGLALGRWYAVNGAPDVFVSAMQPQAAASDLPALARRRISLPDAVEGAALDYLIAFDLTAFDLGFALGTDHPRVGWSERVLDSVRDPRLPGPDGIDSIAPLASTGMLSPAQAARAVATFTGGFKREHGAFRWGPLAQVNHGSHYGFIEQGVIFSKLQPGLSTLYVLDDGSVGMKTWTRADDALLPRLRHARQNGVPLIEYDAATNESAPGALVTAWGAGNWSGSADEKLRTLRAGACLVDDGARRYLIYGYFSTATPAAMARVFLAYGCRYAMHLDMNALEHTYLAVYSQRDGQRLVQHLVEGMEEVDRKGGADQIAPRFLGFPDDRDFFYLLRRPPSGSPP
jgi:hypothetical protein